MRYGQKCPGGLFFADDDAGPRLVKQKNGGGINPTRTKHPHHKETVGSALLSHNPPVAVPSAQKGLTSRFGKDTGCNPLAKTTNTTKISNTPKKGITTHQSVKQYIHLTTQPTNPKGSEAVLAVNRTVDANTIKNNTPTKQGRCNKNLLLVIGQLVLVSWSPYNVYTPSLSTR